MRLARAIFCLLIAALPLEALAQQSILQGGATTSGHVPGYITGGTGQPIVIDSGPAGGNTAGQGISEFNITARGTGTAPFASQGTGPNGEVFCLQDAVSTNATGYHSLCFSANAAGGGLMSYQAGGVATALPFNFKVNGTVYSFPFSVGGITGPATTVVNDGVCWNNTVGTLVKTCATAVPLTIGGSNGQVQYNNAGALGGFTMGGDATLVASTGALTVSKIGGVAVSLAGAFTTSGAFPVTLTAVGATTLTLPQAGTLATLAGSEALTNKTINGLTITASTGTLTITNGKTLTASNTLILAGTDGSTLNIGTGGTLGSAAFTAATAYVPSATQITNSLSGNVAMNAAGSYFLGPTIAQGTTGTWFASGGVTFGGSAIDSTWYVKLWDGVTVIDSRAVGVVAGAAGQASVSGYLASPAGNIRISVRNSAANDGTIFFNTTGNSKDGTVSAFRVQ